MRNGFVAFVHRNLRSTFLGAAALISIGGVTLAVTSPQFIYSQPQAGSYSISSLDMVPEGTGAADNYFASESVLAQGADKNTRECFGTGVHLPKGAKLKNVALYYNSPQKNSIFLLLHSYSPPHNVQHFIVAQDVGNDAGLPSTVNLSVPASTPPVDNLHFHYTYVVCLSDGAAMLGGRVDYTYTSAGD